MKTTATLNKEVEAFNEKYNVGDIVEVSFLTTGGKTFTDIIKHKATVLAGHTAVVWLESKGSYNVKCVQKKVTKIKMSGSSKMSF